MPAGNGSLNTGAGHADPDTLPDRQTEEGVRQKGGVWTPNGIWTWVGAAYLCICVCVHVLECVFERDRLWALTRQGLMHVFIRAWGEAERTGQ